MTQGHYLIATKKSLRKRVVKRKLYKWFKNQKKLSAKEIWNLFTPDPIIVRTFSGISKKSKKYKSLFKFAKEGRLDCLLVKRIEKILQNIILF